jgi:hypothetical protein
MRVCILILWATLTALAVAQPDNQLLRQAQAVQQDRKVVVGKTETQVAKNTPTTEVKLTATPTPKSGSPTASPSPTAKP